MMILTQGHNGSAVTSGTARASGAAIQLSPWLLHQTYQRKRQLHQFHIIHSAAQVGHDLINIAVTANFQP